jgi:WhiB family redox-sensing transcriptional regulator
MTTTTRLATTNATDWRAYAACAQVDGELFFPIGDNQAAREQAAEAKKVCARCPAEEQCLQWALDNRQDTGVWGGLTEEERYRIHRRRGDGYWSRRRDVAEHLYTTRLDEFRGLLAQELTPVEIAQAMGTNVQTVNRLLDRLAADAAAQERVNAA